jgi:hypothetical protein
MKYSFYLVTFFSGVPGFTRRFITYADSSIRAKTYATKKLGKPVQSCDITIEPLAVAIETGKYPDIWEVQQT